MNHSIIKSFRIKNFKAIQESGTVELSPLTIFIGNNGSGKSSFLESLEAYHTIIKQGVVLAMNRWRGFEQVRNQISEHELKILEDTFVETNPTVFELRQKIDTSTFRANMSVTLDSKSEVFIQGEKLFFGNKLIVERQINNRFYFPEVKSYEFSAKAGNEFSILSNANLALWATLSRYINSRRTTSSSTKLIKWLKNINQNKRFWESFNWQFVLLNPHQMVNACTQKQVWDVSEEQFRTVKSKMMGTLPRRMGGSNIQLDKYGANIAKYLLNIRKIKPSIYKGILETLQNMLPYAKDLVVVLSTELERSVYLQMTDRTCQIAEWLLSSGTLRIVTLLALLRHPTPPPLIVIEELENGLAPRTLQLIVEEIRKVVKSGKTQIIISTHSPYLLNLLRSEHIVLVERDEVGQPMFTRATKQKELDIWANGW